MLHLLVNCMCIKNEVITFMITAVGNRTNYVLGTGNYHDRKTVTRERVIYQKLPSES